MTVNGAELAMLTDARLSSDARVLGLYVASKGKGAHEITRSDFACVLSADAGKERVQKGLGQLEQYGWVARSPGGRGHPDRFEFRGRENPHLNADRVGGNPPLNADSSRETRPLNADSDRQPPTLSDRGRENPPLNGPPFSPLQSPLSPPCDVDETKPPVVPRWELAIEKHDLLLTGCRDSLRDYLQAAVPVEQREAYVQTVAAWLNDAHPGIWQRPSGGWLPKEHRPGVLAAAFNELRAGDERSMKRPLGDPGNLATKLDILIKRWEKNGSGNHLGRRAPSESRVGAAAHADQSTRRRRTYSDE